MIESMYNVRKENMMKRKILALVLLSSMIVNISAADTPPPPYDALAEHSFATLVGAVAGAGSTLYLNNNAPLDVVGKNTVITAIIANGVVGGRPNSWRASMVAKVC